MLRKRLLSKRAHTQSQGQGGCSAGPACTDLLAPGSLQSLESLYVATVEGIKGVDQPLPVSAPQGLQHRVHELRGQRRLAGSAWSLPARTLPGAHLRALQS